jgi:hypothetical protein
MTEEAPGVDPGLRPLKPTSLGLHEHDVGPRSLGVTDDRSVAPENLGRRPGTRRPRAAYRVTDRSARENLGAGPGTRTHEDRTHGSALSAAGREKHACGQTRPLPRAITGRDAARSSDPRHSPLGVRIAHPPPQEEHRPASGNVPTIPVGTRPHVRCSSPWWPSCRNGTRRTRCRRAPGSRSGDGTAGNVRAARRGAGSDTTPGRCHRPHAHPSVVAGLFA